MSDDQPLTTMSLPSDRKEIPRTNDFVDEISHLLQIGKERSDVILLALSEAVTNAIVHGNKEEASKKVRLRAWTEDHYLHISIEDEGEGFDPETLPDPLKDQNLLKEGGRGVFLMRQYADQVKFSNEGSTVTLSFSLTD